LSASNLASRSLSSLSFFLVCVCVCTRALSRSLSRSFSVSLSVSLCLSVCLSLFVRLQLGTLVAYLASNALAGQMTSIYIIFKKPACCSMTC
jgi:hypothetical protein